MNNAERIVKLKEQIYNLENTINVKQFQIRSMANELAKAQADVKRLKRLFTLYHDLLFLLEYPGHVLPPDAPVNLDNVIIADFVNKKRVA